MLSLIIRVIISFILGIMVFKSSGNGFDISGIFFFVLFWILIYIMTSLYCHAVNVLKRLGIGKSIFGLVFAHIVGPILIVAVYFTVIPEVIGDLMPDKWAESIQNILTFIFAFVVLAFDIWKAREEYIVRKMLKDDKAEEDKVVEEIYQYEASEADDKA